jgi:hypothetical protein
MQKRSGFVLLARLSHRSVLVTSFDPVEIARVISDTALAGSQTTRFRHVLGIKGEEFSGRVFLLKESKIFPSVEMNRAFTSLGIAEELMSLVGNKEARYHPRSCPKANAQKGWEISHTMIDDSPAVIALAKWVFPQ